MSFIDKNHESIYVQDKKTEKGVLYTHMHKVKKVVWWSSWCAV
jgi:hypothetical protein